MSCTRIEIKLCEEAANALGAEWGVLDLAPEFSLRLTKEVETVDDLGKLNLESSLAFSAPRGTTNDYCLMPFLSPSRLDLNYDGLECRVWTGNYQHPYDRIYYVSKQGAWELSFQRNSQHWADLAALKRLNDIDSGSFNFTKANVEALWPTPEYTVGGDMCRFPFVDYGGWIDKSEPIQFTDPPVKQITLEDLRPLYSEVGLLIQGFCEIGWTLQGTILENDFVRRWYAYILKPQYYNESRGGDLKMTIGFQNGNPINPGFPFNYYLKFNEIIYDPGGIVLIGAPPGIYCGGVKNTTHVKCTYRFTLTGQMYVTAAVPNFEYKYEWKIAEALDDANQTPTGQFLTDNEILVQKKFTTSGPKSHAFNAYIDVDLEPGQIGRVFVDGSATGLVNYRLTVEFKNNSLVRGDVVELKKLIAPQYFLLDLLKGLLHKVNGVMRTDWENKIVTIYPLETSDVQGVTVDGFVIDSEFIDISQRIVVDSEKVYPIKNSVPIYTVYEFADTTDAYIESLEYVEPPFLKKITNGGSELKDDEQRLQNPFFEPTLNGRSETLSRVFNAGNTAFLPRMYDNLDGERSFEIGPRTIYLSEPNFQNEGDEFFNVDELPNLPWYNLALFIFPQAYQTKPVKMGNTEDYPTGNIVYGSQRNDLFTTFYLGKSLQNKLGTGVDLLVMMNAADWDTWDFRRGFLFRLDGIPVVGYGQKIRDFATCADIPTPMTLTIPPSLSACCDGPCGCVFKQCDYYQDFSPNMYRDTLDALYINSFVVNGVEQLGANVGFGVLNLIIFEGVPYVTNLVDALNGIGVAYFLFSYSSYEFSSRKIGRAFKIKHPACYSFRIEISNSDGLQYWYTESEMKNNVFGSGVGFGYGEAFAEPVNCEQYTEY